MTCGPKRRTSLSPKIGLRQPGSQSEDPRQLNVVSGKWPTNKNPAVDGTGFDLTRGLDKAFEKAKEAELAPLKEEHDKPQVARVKRRIFEVATTKKTHNHL